MRFWRALMVLVLFSFFTQGCGGGGGGGDSAAEKNANAVQDNIGVFGLVDLGDLVEPKGDHWYHTEALALNDNGLVVGKSNANGITTQGAFIWDPDTKSMEFLGIDPCGVFSEAADINNSNEVIVNSIDKEGLNCSTAVWRNEALYIVPGNAFKSNDINEKGEVVGVAKVEVAIDEIIDVGFYWDGVSAGIFPLGAVIGAGSSEAVAINENSQVVINSSDTVIFHDLNHNVVETLNHLPGAELTVAVDINDSIYTNNDGIPDGHVIGNSGRFDQSQLASVMSGISTAIAISGGDNPSQPSGEPVSGMFPGLGSAKLNDILGGASAVLTAGQVDVEEPLGLAITEIEEVQGFFWDGGAMYPISDFGGGLSVVSDINDADQVVGGALTADGKTRAFIWTLDSNKKGVLEDLGTLGGQHSFALAINEAGQVVGWSSTGEFYAEDGFLMPIVHGFIWENGTMYDLGVHNDFYDYPFIPPYPFSVAVDINEYGDLAGNSRTINEHLRGFYRSDEPSPPQ